MDPTFFTSSFCIDYLKKDFLKNLQVKYSFFIFLFVCILIFVLQEEQLDAILSTAVETSSLGLITGCIKQWTAEGTTKNKIYLNCSCHPVSRHT